MPLFKKNKVAPKPAPPPPTPPPPPSQSGIPLAKSKMNTALLKDLWKRKTEEVKRIADNWERDARAARYNEARRNTLNPNIRRIAAYDAEVAAAAQRARDAAALVARTTIAPASIPVVPGIRAPPRPIAEYKNGGLVKKTGLVKVHKGEIVIKKERVAAVMKAVKKAGLRPLTK